MILIGLGALLATGSILLPWYVFLHQDQFGVRAMKFGGRDTSALGGAGTAPSSRTTAGEPAAEKPQARLRELDAMPTGTLQPRLGANEDPPGLAEQPFPRPDGAFRLLHAANGRALIEDEHGIWLVRTGSFLPDNSRIAAIEERSGQWVIVTSDERVIETVR